MEQRQSSPLWNVSGLEWRQSSPVRNVSGINVTRILERVKM